MTIGYGLPASMSDAPYFNECSSALFLITVESIFGAPVQPFTTSHPGNSHHVGTLDATKH